MINIPRKDLFFEKKKQGSFFIGPGGMTGARADVQKFFSSFFKTELLSS